jgi:glucose-1-phosphate thymidylyltransferase
MKALITSGGRGTRLRPITHTKNKHLIPVANKPMLHYAIEAVRDAGVRDIGVVYSADSDEVPRSLGDGSAFGVRLTHIAQEAPLGLAHVVKISEDFIGREPFIFYLGDNMIVGGLNRFVAEFQRLGSNCHLTLARVRDPERFGVPELAPDGRIIGIEEKPSAPKSPYAVAGIYLYDGSIFEACNQIQPSARGELEISDAHQWLLDHDKAVTYSEITGWWKDTGKPVDLLEANRLVLEHQEARCEGEVDEASDLTGNVVIERGARIVGSVIRGPAIIGERTLVENSYVGPFTSIYHDCHLRGSEIDYSIVLSRVQILDVESRIEGSLLGDEVELVAAVGKPRVNRFMLSDQSRVEVA